jgi:TetR/AcrR family tetracycline transcriptional repressor
VLQAGLQLVDREGVDALTMRRLGKELGVEAMSLYGYVANKQDLLDGVVDCVYGEIRPATGALGSWSEQLRAAARQFRLVLLRHPNMVGLLAKRLASGDGGLALVEAMLADLLEAGLDLVRAHQVVTVVIGFTVGHAANQVGGVPLCETVVDGELDDTRFPNVAARTGALVDHEADFDLGLDFIVAGVGRMLVNPSRR